MLKQNNVSKTASAHIAPLFCRAMYDIPTES